MFRNQHGIRRIVTYVGTMIVVTVVGVGISFAAAGWLASGNAPATASGASSLPGTLVVSTGTAGTGLSPGTNVNGIVTVKNTTSVTMIVTTVALGAVTGSSDSAVLASVPAGDVGTSIAANATVSLPVNFAMSSTAGAVDENGTFSVTATVTASNTGS